MHPAVMFIHGGGLMVGGRNQILPSRVEAFNANGFQFVSVDYRLAPETKLPEAVRDVEDAWAWLHASAKSVGIDSNRIPVMGHSAGGYLALIGGFRLDPKPAAVISLAGYGDPTHEVFATPSHHYLTAHAPVEHV